MQEKMIKKIGEELAKGVGRQVKLTKERGETNVTRKMRAGLSKSACRSGLQSAL